MKDTANMEDSEDETKEIKDINNVYSKAAIRSVNYKPFNRIICK